jgi:polysaccharide biosynthesis/export protein
MISSKKVENCFTRRFHQMNQRLPLLVMAMVVAVFFTAQGLCYGQEPLPPSYRIGPNDLLSIHVWKEPELSRDIVVTPDGKISFPLIGEIEVQGKSVTELKNLISEKLLAFVTAPEVTVIVRESRSRMVYAIGKVRRPGPYPLVADMTVIQALSAAGGLAEWANEKNIMIIRKEGDKETQLRFNYKDFTRGRNVEQNILLQPGDTILVP